jgi:hypothetical protein
MCSMYVIGTVWFEYCYYAQIITDMLIFNWANNQIKTLKKWKWTTGYRNLLAKMNLSNRDKINIRENQRGNQELTIQR